MANANIHATRGVSIREFPLNDGHGVADYLFYIDGKAAGVIEAKKAGVPLIGVEHQSGRYVQGLPASLPAWRRPLPFAYESTGVETRFTSGLDPEPRSRAVFAFHRPETLVDWLRGVHAAFGYQQDRRRGVVADVRRVRRESHRECFRFEETETATHLRHIHGALVSPQQRTNVREILCTARVVDQTLQLERDQASTLTTLCSPKGVLRGCADSSRRRASGRLAYSRSTRSSPRMWLPASSLLCTQR
jgi:hypothetical protein